jgi:hypothetical protein
VFQGATPNPPINFPRDPSKLDWKAVARVEHYLLHPDSPRAPVHRAEQDQAP